MLNRLNMLITEKKEKEIGVYTVTLVDNIKKRKL